MPTPTSSPVSQENAPACCAVFFFSRLFWRGRSLPPVTPPRDPRLTLPRLAPFPPSPLPSLVHEPRVALITYPSTVLVAEVVSHFYPRLVELHNYSSANSLSQKMYNWNTLNTKVFKRLGFAVIKQDCEDIANNRPGAIERVLKLVKFKMAKFQEKHGVMGPGGGGGGGTGHGVGAAANGSRPRVAGTASRRRRRRNNNNNTRRRRAQKSAAMKLVPDAPPAPEPVGAPIIISSNNPAEQEGVRGPTSMLTALRQPHAQLPAAPEPHPAPLAQKTPSSPSSRRQTTY